MTLRQPSFHSGPCVVSTICSAGHVQINSEVCQGCSLDFSRIRESRSLIQNLTHSDKETTVIHTFKKISHYSINWKKIVSKNHSSMATGKFYVRHQNIQFCNYHKKQIKSLYTLFPMITSNKNASSLPVNKSEQDLTIKLIIFFDHQIQIRF